LTRGRGAAEEAPARLASAKDGGTSAGKEEAPAQGQLTGPGRRVSGRNHAVIIGVNFSSRELVPQAKASGCPGGRWGKSAGLPRARAAWRRMASRISNSAVRCGCCPGAPLSRGQPGLRGMAIRSLQGKRAPNASRRRQRTMVDRLSGALKPDPGQGLGAFLACCHISRSFMPVGDVGRDSSSCPYAWISARPRDQLVRVPGYPR